MCANIQGKVMSLSTTRRLATIVRTSLDYLCGQDAKSQQQR